MTRIERRLALLQVLLGGTSFAAETLAEALVIGTLGAAWMPVGLAGAGMLSFALTTSLARHPTSSRRLPGLAGTTLCIGVAIWIGLFVAPTAAAFVFLLMSRPLRDALTVTAGNVIASRYDAQAAKRALPRMAAISQTGAILVGLALPILLRIGGTPAAVIVWPFLAGSALVVAWRLPLVMNADAMPTVTPNTATESAARTLRRSPLFRSLAVLSMLAVSSGVTLGFAAALILSTSIPNPVQLASLYSLIGVLSSIGVLAIQLGVLPPLLRRIGTAPTALLAPTIAFGVASWVLIAGSLTAGLAAQVSRLTLRPALQTPIEEILLGLLPLNERAIGRAWLRGGAIPIAGVCTTLSLAVLAAVHVSPRLVAGMALTMAMGGCIAAIIVRQQHRHAALALAREGDVLTQRLTLPAFGGVDASVKEEIASRLGASERDDERLLLVALLADLDPPAATTAVARLLPAVAPETTAALLMSLAERSCPTTALLPEATLLFASPLAVVRKAALTAFATTPELPDIAVAPLLEDADPGVVLVAVARLADTAGPDAIRARSQLLALVQSDSVDIRANAAALVARVAPEALVALLTDHSVTVRRAAALAAGASATSLTPVAETLLALTGDSASSVRAAAITALAHLGPAATPLLVTALDDPVSTVRAAATATLLETGSRQNRTLALQPSIGTQWGQAAKFAILTRWASWRWRTALLSEEGNALTDTTRLAIARIALGEAKGPAGSLLRRDIDDEIADSLMRWQECLSITDGAGTARVILQGLEDTNSVVRAQAQEALEAVRSPAIARLAVGLVAPVRAAMGALLADPSPPASRIGHTSTLDALFVGSGQWRQMLFMEAAHEEPGLLIGHKIADTRDGKEGTMLSLVERATLLRSIPPFADLPSEQLRLLAGIAEEIEAPAGETVVAAGSSGDHLYVVIAGQIALDDQRGAKGSVARVSTLGPGSALGEDAVFDGSIHVLSASAVTDCRLLTLSREVLLALLEEQPALARSLIAWLSARLRETTGKLAERTRPRPRSVMDLLDQLGDKPR